MAWFFALKWHSGKEFEPTADTLEGFLVIKICSNYLIIIKLFSPFCIILIYEQGILH